VFTSVKGILLILFLYLALVLTAVTSWHFSSTPAGGSLDIGGIAQDSLRYAAYGIGTLLALIIGSWGFAQLKSLRSRSPTPKAQPVPAKTQPKLSEDVRGLQDLLQEAAKRLKSSRKFSPGSDENLVFSGMPVYLIVGPEGVGKTSIVINSGLEPELLAGQPGLERSSVPSTTVANIWLAGEALLVEIGGRHFSGDPARWEELLHTLNNRPKVALWKRLLRGNPDGFDFRGIVHCCDLRFFVSKPGPDQIERQSQLVQQRLRAAVRVLGRPLPVYNVFCKADLLRYFREFFGRFSEQEADQILGCTLRFEETSQGDADTALASKTLSKAFHNLYLALTERRLSILFQEPMAGRKSKIFEFPREFNRLRQSVVDFLAQTFRSSPLEATPINRGFYFCGTREVEAQSPQTDPGTKGLDFAIDATVIFRDNIAEAPKPGSVEADLNLTRVRRGGLQTRWAFLSSLFQDVIANDRLSEAFVPAASERVEAKPLSKPAVVVLAVSIAFFGLWCISWVRNARAVASVERVSSGVSEPVSPGALPTLSQFESLEALRTAVVALDERAGHFNLTMRMGLYSIPELREKTREAYFGRLKDTLVEPSHRELASFLESLQQPFGLDQPTSKDVVDGLRAYVMTTTRPEKCKVDPQIVSQELAFGMGRLSLDNTDPRYGLAAKQVEFFANELKARADQGLVAPIVFPPNESVKQAAGNYLASLGITEQYYRSLVGELDGETPSLKLTDVAPGYDRVLSVGQREVSSVFTPSGYGSFRTRISSPGTSPVGDPCIAGSVDESKITALGDRERTDLSNSYAREYLKTWGYFLSEVHVTRFTSAQDAAEKLQILGGNNSPVIAVLKFVAQNTSFERPQTARAGGTETLAQKALTAATRAAEALFEPPNDVIFDLAGVKDAFQPAQAVVPPQENRLNDPDINGPYMKALLDLSGAMLKIARTAASATDAEANTLAVEAADHAESEVRALTTKFNQTSFGVDELVLRLQREPIERARELGDLRVTPSEIGKRSINGRLTQLCRDLRSPVLNRYPFAPTTSQDISLKDFTEWFAPDQGRLWTSVQQDFAKIVTRENKIWRPSPASQDLRVSADFLRFLNRAQDLTNVLFSDGKTLGMEYTFRPDGSNRVLEFRIDGDPITFDQQNQVRHRFTWPGKQDQSAHALRDGVEFAGGQGPWAVFRMFRRTTRPAAKVARWEDALNGGILTPPVQIVFTELPGDLDVFVPSFFEGLRCPQVAVE